MPEIEQIESAFESVSDAWQNCRESIGDLVDQKQGDEVFGWAENFRDAFLESCREVTDEVDRSYVMIVKYIEARCVWAKYTAKANYTTAYKDTVDGEAMLRASLMSQVLVALEKIVDTDTLESVNEFLAATSAVEEDNASNVTEEAAS